MTPAPAAHMAAAPPPDGQREDGHRQDPEQAARHRADVRRGRPQGIEDPNAGGHLTILTPPTSVEMKLASSRANAPELCG